MTSPDLVAFLNARLGEDEAAANTASRSGAEWELRAAEPYEEWPASFGIAGDRARFAVGDAAEGAHVARHDPARVLREVEAKRRILARYEDCLARMEDPDYSASTARDQAREYEDFALPALAAVYSDHPDYDPAWA